MLTTQLPGFKDPVHDAQQTFRALLDALARPGIQQTTASLTPPEGLNPGCAAACLTLLDLETTVWLQPDIAESARSWLVFHTGCRFTAQPQTADFAVINNVETMPNLEDFNWGTAAYPEASTSLLIQLPALEGTGSATLQGPGILESITLQTPLSTDFWQQWQAMTAHYPLGLDVWCFADRQVLGLPRTTRIAGKQEGW
ncbi:phosphonate C-P lyase system protein PhnH [Phormidium tenue]|uniref:Phosphonate C-P lyase system protein PhnH n=1 Tax=Phormidium tenue NIES-30 TaxID=549789 RepID=A0A1U7J063_9CYAN|nr:phosphonate C-P lyase system protein PhnH [Phormidium tenue]MBD2231655.1 phosphonate C-P lyase system protein PhnH [Phormidium tenue FACHB-1052]OKH44843.1 phosphonate C-P lyase system protein PhnH [Phormidium tenue NIES-30]